MLCAVAQYFTKDGLQKLKDELHELKTKEMRRVVKLIAEAAAFGDLKENAAYHDARNMKSYLLGRIEQLENAVNDAVIVLKKDGSNIQVGSKIEINFDGKDEKYNIVGPTEANILQNKISYQSPLGAQLIGKKEGDKFDYEINGKKIKVRILSVN